MLVTVTNTSGGPLNSPDQRVGTIPGPGTLLATGGNIVDPLPHPFGHIGELANGASSAQLAMHARDWRYSRTQMKDGFEPSLLWQGLVQAGKVTLAVVAEADRTNQEEEFLTLV